MNSFIKTSAFHFSHQPSELISQVIGIIIKLLSFYESVCVGIFDEGVNFSHKLLKQLSSIVGEQ